jgi:hypothetical protein
VCISWLPSQLQFLIKCCTALVILHPARVLIGHPSVVMDAPKILLVPGIRHVSSSCLAVASSFVRSLTIKSILEIHYTVM